eukprot:TRINITY_DN5364_c0_g1_i1.p1 TRINITY_DN5364_c0_g1~~TRINITY_DN5364_c0_g1_i1.p1  ORF type:complete len:669 (-),score=138.64 TRINITY_DN5364_c0_g1_i1:31-2037(-)
MEGLVQVQDILRKKEKIYTSVFLHPHEANKYVAQEIATLIRQKQDAGLPAVLGLATGGTPKGVYTELIRLHKEEGLSFQNVITFNLDEYYPMDPKQAQSYVAYMNSKLFDHIDIKKENIHIPDGSISPEEVNLFCAEYENKINNLGIDIQLLGIGQTGHIGFNEPGSNDKTVTRLVYLDKKTRGDAASGFFGIDAVPKQAITMGVGTILSSTRIFILAFSEHKASIIAKAIEGEITPQVSASYLQNHPNAEAVIDIAASSQLTRVSEPWTLIGNSSSYQLDWGDDEVVKRAVIWLSLHINKSILRLRENDYIENNLEQLVNRRGHSNINRMVFNFLSNTITGWPGGKPNEEYFSLSQSAKIANLNQENQGFSTREPQDYIIKNRTNTSVVNTRIKNAEIYPKTILVFSPHPDDDVISMGGTFLRLIEQGHNVHVAYQTSGNIAVWDDDVKRHMHFVKKFCETFDIEGADKADKLDEEVNETISSKLPGQSDNTMLLKIKGLIRETEAMSAARYCGLPVENIHFLHLPFYETGTVKKNPLSEADIDIVHDLINDLKPHQIYAAGDLSDPHGTHRVCLTSILGALERIKDEEWFTEENQLFLYRGAWEEWEPHMITMAVPVSPDELIQKRYAIFKHESQKDVAPFPGGDEREFWVRSESRNRYFTIFLYF